MNDEKLIVEGLLEFKWIEAHDQGVYLMAGNRFYCIKELDGAYEINSIIKIEDDTRKTYAAFTINSEWIIFVPHASENILLYNMNNRERQYVKIPDLKCRYDKTKKFSNAYVVEDKVFFAANRYPGILCMDLKRRQCINLMGWYDQITQKMRYKGDRLLGEGGCISGRYIYIPSSQNDSIVRICIDTLDTEVCFLNSDDTYINSICSDGNNFWIAGDKGIMKWNYNKGIIARFEYPQNFQFKTNCSQFSACVQYMGEVIFVPRAANMFIKIKLSNGNKMETEVIEECSSLQRYIASKNSNKLYIYDNSERKLICYNEFGERIEYENKITDFLKMIVTGGYI